MTSPRNITKISISINLLIILIVITTSCNPPLPSISGDNEQTPLTIESTNIEIVAAPTVDNTPTALPTEVPTEVPPIILEPPLVLEVKYDLFAPHMYGPEKENFPTDVSALTAMPVSDPQMLDLGAVMVSITNFPANARPQAGLSDAPHVYEMFIGDGQTRFLAVFYGEQPEQEPMVQGNFAVRQGPFVRSALIIGNQVFLDENGNGIHDLSEWGIGGVGVSLFDGATGGILDSTTTDSNGFYGFNVIPGHQYFIQVLLPGGFKFSQQFMGVDARMSSKVDPINGISPVFTVFHDNLDWDAGLVPINPWRHVPEGVVVRDVRERDYALEAEYVIERLKDGKVDLSSYADYTYTSEILTGLAVKGFKDPGDAVMPGLYGFPKPLGWNIDLMQSLVDAWGDALVAQQGVVRDKANLLIDRLRAGDMNAVVDAKVMMLILGGKIADDPFGDNGPFRILPDGENAALMQSLVDAARDGAANYAAIQAENLRQGDLRGFDETVRLALFLREKRFIMDEDMGGILGILPKGKNERAMQVLVDALREGLALQANKLIERLNQGELTAVREASMSMLMLAEKRDIELDSDGLPIPEGPNAEVMQSLADAIRLSLSKATAFDTWTGTRQVTVTGPPGKSGLMCPALVRTSQVILSQEVGGEVEVAPLPANAMIYSSQDGFPAIYFTTSIPVDWMNWAAGETRVTILGDMEGYGISIIFPPRTTFKQKSDSTIIIVFPPKTEEGTEQGEGEDSTSIPLSTGENDPCINQIEIPLGTNMSVNPSTGQSEVNMMNNQVTMSGNSVSVQPPGGGAPINFTVPEGTSLENNMIQFPSEASVYQDGMGNLFVDDSGCHGPIFYNPSFLRSDWNLIGPTRSGRIYMTQFGGFFSGGCLVYAHKDPSVSVAGCQVVVENYQFADVNGAGLDPSKIKEIGLNSRPPGWETVNYSGNIFAIPGSNFWGTNVLGKKNLRASLDVTPGAGVLASPIAVVKSELKYIDTIHMFYSNLNQTLWKYDPSSQAYLRYEDLADPKQPGVFIPSLDRFTGRQLYFANVLILFAPHDVVRANVINVELEGREGYGLLFKYGTVQKIFWNTYQREFEKETQRSRPIKIVDADGNPYPLAPGQSWYHLVVLNADSWEVEPYTWKIRNYEPE